MTADFSSIHNHHEQAVFDAVMARSADHPGLKDDPDLLADVACVALNRLPARYIRHSADFAFFLTERERSESDLAIREAVDYAYGYVQARVAMRARR